MGMTHQKKILFISFNRARLFGNFLGALNETLFLEANQNAQGLPGCQLEEAKKHLQWHVITYDIELTRHKFIENIDEATNAFVNSLNDQKFDYKFLSPV
jgi:hypothetical protein